MKREKTVFKVDLRYITYHSHIIKTDQSIQAFRKTLLEKGDKPMRKRWFKRFAVVALATAVSVYTVPKTGLLAALGLSQTSDAVLDGQTITSTGTDENAVNVSEGANVTVKNLRYPVNPPIVPAAIIRAFTVWDPRFCVPTVY